MQIGSHGIPAMIASILAAHFRNASVARWCLVALLRLSSAPQNLSIFKSIILQASDVTGDAAGICTIVSRTLQCHCWTNINIVTLCLELIVQLCTDEQMREQLAKETMSQPSAQGIRENFILIALAHHLSSPVCIKIGCEALSAICVSPLDDALAFLQARSCGQNGSPYIHNSKSLKLSDPVVCGEKRTGSETSSTDWTTYEESPIRPPTGIPDSDPSRADSTQQPQQQHRKKQSIFNSLSTWVSGSNVPPSASAVPSAHGNQSFAPINSPIKPMQAILSVSKIVPQSKDVNSSNMYSYIVSAGLSDQEEQQLALKNHQKAMGRIIWSSVHEALLAAGAPVLLTALIQTYALNSRNKAKAVKERAHANLILIAALNSLNSLCLHPAVRSVSGGLNNEGLYDLLQSTFSFHLNLSDEDELKNGIDSPTRRTLLTLIAFVVGTLCLPSENESEISAPKTSKADFNPKHSKQQTLIASQIPESIQNELGQLGFSELMLDCLKRFISDEPLVCEAALRALFYLVSGHESNQRRLSLAASDSTDSLDCCGYVMQLLKKHIDRPRIAYYSCLAIAALTVKNNSIVQGVDHLSICDLIVKVLIRYIDREEVTEASCYAIYALKELNGALGRVGVCEYVLQVVSLIISK